MFGASYFGTSYFGPAYFGPGRPVTTTPEPEETQGAPDSSYEDLDRDDSKSGDRVVIEKYTQLEKDLDLDIETGERIYDSELDEIKEDVKELEADRLKRLEEAKKKSEEDILLMLAIVEATS